MIPTTPLRRRPGSLCVLALALATSFAFAHARADEPAPDEWQTYALSPDSAAAPSGPVASAQPVEGSDPAPPTPEVAAVPASDPPASDAPAPDAAPASDQPAAKSVDAESDKAASDAPKKDPEKAAAPKPAASKSAAPKNSVKKASAPAPENDPNHPDEGARVRQSVESTEGVLRSVNTKVIRSRNKKAREEFEKARGLQREAREALGQNLFARADRLTQESRTLARQIAVHLGPPQDDPDYVAGTLGRTDDAIGRAKEVLDGAGGNGERRRLESLERRQKEAHRLFKDGSTREAYGATRTVRDGVLQLLRDCDDLPVPAETAERALKRAARALEQVKSELGERPTRAAAKAARDAHSQMDKARGAYARKNYRDTLLYSKLVERDLELAVSAQRGTTSRNG
ncbi:MAG TPA: hypothetical protein VFS09_09430 [Candidatus Eisenbacteria bacterium]|nr:hypothetical protein [Candidatus Eisenbacteria bacterium]